MMEWIDFVLGLVNGVAVSTLFWGYRHVHFERRLEQVIETLTDEERTALSEKESK